jgi:hypothetical protein
MLPAHFYIFSDASPSDWLTEGDNLTWRTIANFSFQSDPTVSPHVRATQSHENILSLDPTYREFIAALENQLPSRRLRKWKTGPGYRERFCKAFCSATIKYRPIVSACSFQSQTLIDSKAALIASYNSKIGGIEGRGIAFEELLDERGRKRLKHSFLNFHGLHEIEGLQGQILILLFTAWFIADQYAFRNREIKNNPSLGYNSLEFTVVSDKLSGDGDEIFRAKNERNLRNLIDPEHESAPISLTRSRFSDTFSGDLLVDNLAGWLRTAMSEPRGSFAKYALELAPTGVWTGWHHLQPSDSVLLAKSAVATLQTLNA